MKQKLGLVRSKSEEEDRILIDSFLETMQLTGGDFTNCFRLLNQVSILPPGSSTEASEDLIKAVSKSLASQCIPPTRFAKQIDSHVPPAQLERMFMFAQQQPTLLPMLGISLDFLETEKKRQEAAKEMRKVSARDKYLNDRGLWTTWLQRYISTLQKRCADTDGDSLAEVNQKRIEMMNQVNPKFILRNYMAEKAIQLATKGDYSEVERLLSLLNDPFSERMDMAAHQYDSLPPDWADQICVSCSS
eukprot:GILK01009035.1.p1 GENE.GILK01009035.1~~GILK01009035.1.p1  ORF type:complete len:246 (+),score=55.74 GILK01009035.1:165-902(+)